MKQQRTSDDALGLLVELRCWMLTSVLERTGRSFVSTSHRSAKCVWREHLLLQLQCCKISAQDFSPVKNTMQIQCTHSQSMLRCVRVCVCVLGGRMDGVCLVLIPVFSSPAELTMHEYTHSHFTFRSVIHYSDGGQGTHIDYTDLFAKERQKERKNAVQQCRQCLLDRKK